MTKQSYLFLFMLSLATHTVLHAAQANVEMKEQDEKQLTAEGQAAADRMFEIINATNKDNAAHQAQVLQKLLQEYPRILNAKNNNGSTALMRAAWHGHTAIAQALITAGADLNAKSNNGSTALILAAWKGYTAIVQALIAAGADLNLQNNEGHTALMRAALRDHIAIVQALIAAGADATLQNEEDDRKTALDYATERGRWDAYIAAVARGKAERERYTKAQQVAKKELEQHMIPELAKITAEYAYNPAIPADLPEAPKTKQSWWDKAKGLASKLSWGIP